jgi:arylsulfatase A-like enzyme
MPQRGQTRAPAGALVAIGACLLALVTGLALLTEGSAAGATAARSRPNFVVIQTDDQTLDQLYASYTPPGGATIRAMPHTLRLIAKRGATFKRYYVSYSLCCPSRVTLLTGRYAHNHNVRGNVPPNGGYPGFAARAAFHHNLAVWLQDAGYRTIHVGKFLNGYGDAPFDDGKTVPPGWSAWHSVLHPDSDHFFYGYTMNDDGAIDGPFGDSGSWETREYGARDDPGCPNAPQNGQPCYYQTDHLTQNALDEMSATPPSQPLYLQLDYTAPHGDFRRPAGPEPAPRYYDSMVGANVPHSRAQGFDEANVRDKPSFIRNAPKLTQGEIRTYRVYYEKSLESLRSIDDGVKRIVDRLGGLHRLGDTYILFVSDNGFFYGEHRLTGGKFLAYEPSTHLPFLIRGPGIKPGTQSSELTANIDIAPTVLQLAGVRPDRSVDGRSVMPFALDPRRHTNRPILFESFVETSDVEENGGGPPSGSGRVAARGHRGAKVRGGASASIVAPAKDYYGIRLGPWKYIAWPNGEKELYDIATDPYELNNRARDANLFPIRSYLSRELRLLKNCAGVQCRKSAPPIPLTRAQQRRKRRMG